MHSGHSKVTIKDIVAIFTSLGSIVSLINLLVGLFGPSAVIFFYVTGPGLLRVMLGCALFGFFAGSYYGYQKAQIPNLVLPILLGIFLITVHLFLITVTRPEFVQVFTIFGTARKFLLVSWPVNDFLTALPYGGAVACISSLVILSCRKLKQAN